MCGIFGIYNRKHQPVPHLGRGLGAMNHLLKHRGPDGEGAWMHERGFLGLGHRRLSIIDLSEGGQQPMTDRYGNWVVYNGEIYNYIELREELGVQHFQSTSDTEVILLAYRRWGKDCVKHFRGMFAFALWDESKGALFCARDRFGIKPFYYMVQDGMFYFASEPKALLPFAHDIATDLDSLKEYLTFQFCMGGKTLFKGIHELLPAHVMMVEEQAMRKELYWDVYFSLDQYHTAPYFQERLRELITDSVRFHLRSDVPVGAYVSGGLDSSMLASIASDFQQPGEMIGFTGKFSQYGPAYDESQYAREIARAKDFQLLEIDITASDFIQHIQKVIYHLDYPTAGPGSFPQYMVSQLAAKHRKVVLGGQGGDEIFGGYTRYLIAYFEQCIKGAIEGTIHNGDFIVTYESIIPNLGALRPYIPLLQEFWREGLFEPMDRRYFRLVNRAPSLDKEICWEKLEPYSARATFQSLFNSNNARKESYFDLMTHFDFKTLLPALLQVEDRMSMANGLESRVPLLDYPIVELAATIPANIKFKNGDMKHVYKKAIEPYLPEKLLNRTDKMGFPTPLFEWLNGEARDFVTDIFSSEKAKTREIIDNTAVLAGLAKEPRYGRKVWGLLSLEIWQQEFHDKAFAFKKMIQ